MSTISLNSFGSRAILDIGNTQYEIHRLEALERAGVGHVDRLPFSFKILLENLLRREDSRHVSGEDISALASWTPSEPTKREISFMPTRVLLQDFTGVSAVVDLAAMRNAMRGLGGLPQRINPLQPVDLVIDHSGDVDYFGTSEAFAKNLQTELERNKERYGLLRWAQQAFTNFRIIPPGRGIVHQVHLEHLAQVVYSTPEQTRAHAYPDSVVGTDSHTTMINGLGVLGWGVGGIEAEAAMLGQPLAMLIPDVVGVRLTGRLPEGATATDLVLTLTQMLRRKGVFGSFVEFYGDGLSEVSVAHRATIANMAPEYGAICGFFPVDDQTLSYLRLTGRDEALIGRVETYCKEQGLFRTDRTPDPVFCDTLELELNTVEPCLAGPSHPQDRVTLSEVKPSFRRAVASKLGGAGANTLDKRVPLNIAGQSLQLGHGSVVIAAIVSCMNTANPEVMMSAGLLAKEAVARGLEPKPWVKTSFAPGSEVVVDYLREAGLLQYLERLGFYLVGYGCTTCIGRSGPLLEPVSRAVDEGDLTVAAVFSGNRNFEGRIHQQVGANYLASPPLVVAYALVGRMDVDLSQEPIGNDRDGKPVWLRDVWPSQNEIHESMQTISSEMFRKRYEAIFDSPAGWTTREASAGDHFTWNPDSTYIRRPPDLESIPQEAPPLGGIVGARVLVALGDMVTTDHISPAGIIPIDSPAGRYLIERGVEQADFSSYGVRRGNFEVMMRGTFANPRLRNRLVDVDGGVTRHLPSGTEMSIYDAAMRYRRESVPLIIIAGQDYGLGSSRDWAAKGPALLGVRAVIAESFEHAQRSNLVAVGVLPLQFERGQSQKSLGLTGQEQYDLLGIADGPEPGKPIAVRAMGEDGIEKAFSVRIRIDTSIEIEYYRHGGLIPFVLRQLVDGSLGARGTA